MENMMSFASQAPEDLSAEIMELKSLIANKERDNTKILNRATKLNVLMVKYETDIRTELDLVREIENKCANLERQSTDLLKSKLQIKQMRQMNQDRLRELERRRQSHAPAAPITTDPQQQQQQPHRSKRIFSKKPTDPELVRKMRELSELGTEYQAKEARLLEKRLQNQALRNQLTSNIQSDGETDDEQQRSGSGLFGDNLEDSLDWRWFIYYMYCFNSFGTF